MNKNAFQALLWANPKSMAKSFEQSFYDENSSLFSPATNYLNENRSMFDIIKSNIVLFGLLNRKLLNREIDEFPSSSLDDKNVQEALLLQLPYLLYNGKRLYIPTYSLEINELYSSSEIS